MKISNSISILFLGIALLFISPTANAVAWCTFEVGEYQVVSHGTKSDNVWIHGNFSGSSVVVWVPIATASYGKTSVSIALAAQLAGKRVQVFLDGPDDTCATYVTWTGLIRHVQAMH